MGEEETPQRRVCTPTSRIPIKVRRPQVAYQLRRVWSPWLLLLVAGISPALIVLLYLEIWAAAHTHGTCDFLNGVINRESMDVSEFGTSASGSILPPGDEVKAILTRSAVYTLNILFGSYSFAAVKAIDVLWDLLIGRIGQFLLGFISYRVSADAMLAIMESDPVSYDLYTAISISGSGILSAARLVKQIVSRRSWKWVYLLTSLALALSWVLAWPTMMSAMTGYVANDDLYVRLRNRDLASYTNWENYRMTNLFIEIYDGQRIGLTKDYLLSYAKQQDLWTAIGNCGSHPLSFSFRPC
jgi:hypothetical protein